MKKSQLRQIIREEILKINELYDEYDTSHIKRTDLRSFLNYLEMKDISYSMNGNNLEFDITELDKRGQKIFNNLINH